MEDAEVTLVLEAGPLLSAKTGKSKSIEAVEIKQPPTIRWNLQL